MTGTWAYSPGSNSGECDEDTALIMIAQYHRIIPSTRKIDYKGKPGDIIDIEIYLHNRGNGGDVGYLTDDLTRNMDVSDMEVLYPTTEVSLPIHSNISLMLSVVLYDDVKTGRRNIIFQAISKIAENAGNPQEPGSVTIVIDVEKESLLSKFNTMPVILTISGIILFIIIAALVIFIKLKRRRGKRIEYT